MQPLHEHSLQQHMLTVLCKSASINNGSVLYGSYRSSLAHRGLRCVLAQMILALFLLFSQAVVADFLWNEQLRNNKAACWCFCRSASGQILTCFTFLVFISSLNLAERSQIKPCFMERSLQEQRDRDWGWAASLFKKNLSSNYSPAAKRTSVQMHQCLSRANTIAVMLCSVCVQPSFYLRVTIKGLAGNHGNKKPT